MSVNDEKFSVDLKEFDLDQAREKELLEKQNECSFIWTNKQGEPVGVVMCYLAAKGKLWLCMTEERARVAAVRRDPRTCVIISSAGTDMRTGKAVTYKGTSVVHAHDAPLLKGWFFEAYAARLHRGSDREKIRQIMADIDIPERVVIEFTPTKSIGYDGDKMAAKVPGTGGNFDRIFS